jgi:hypothetical protein
MYRLVTASPPYWCPAGNSELDSTGGAAYFVLAALTSVTRPDCAIPATTQLTPLKLDRQLDEFHFSQDAASDALTIVDQTTGRHGEAMTVEEHMSDMLRRHGPNSPNAVAHPQRERYIRAAATRLAERLERLGVDRAHHRIILG